MAKRVAYWNTNIPEEDWTDECPDYLKGVDEYDEHQLGIKDEDYTLMSWNEVKTIVSMSYSITVGYQSTKS